ncbi:hypothetical protein GCM10020220_097930 [Nonomuraea rubra]|uniref:RNA polymerase sigma factor n=1 Tax=Nonomuraea rubra TaxID=46180 RepID=UPI0031EC1872
MAARLGAGAADDVASETFLAAFDQRDQYDLAYPSARAWLYGIATNLIGRHRRAEIRLYRALGRATGPGDVGEPRRPGRRPGERATAEPGAGQGLAGLSEGDRDALLLVACAELSYTEVARAWPSRPAPWARASPGPGAGSARRSRAPARHRTVV